MSHHDAMIYEAKWKGKTVQFTATAEDLECYAENGMKAILTEAVEIDPDVWKVQLKFDAFDEHNLSRESSNYYDKNGNPCLTAREAGFYNPLDWTYLPEPSKWDLYLTVIDDAPTDGAPTDGAVMAGGDPAAQPGDRN